MPVSIRKVRGKFRVVERATGRIAKTKLGNPVDGGGHRSRQKAGRQAGYINEAWKKKNG
jgi:hypothetical protein